MSVHNQEIIIKKGDYTLSQLVIIPSSYTLIIEAGVCIDLIHNGAMIIT